MLCLALPLVACQSVAPAPTAATPAQVSATSEGRVLAEASCGGCHAIGRYGSSSNPNAPPFHAIINQEDLTAETVTTWLRGAHNYPSEMNFFLNESQVNALVVYMLTLRDPHYQRPSD